MSREYHAGVCCSKRCVDTFIMENDMRLINSLPPSSTLYDDFKADSCRWCDKVIEKLNAGQEWYMIKVQAEEDRVLGGNSCTTLLYIGALEKQGRRQTPSKTPNLNDYDYDDYPISPLDADESGAWELDGLNFDSATDTSEDNDEG